MRQRLRVRYSRRHTPGIGMMQKSGLTAMGFSYRIETKRVSPNRLRIAREHTFAHHESEKLRFLYIPMTMGFYNMWKFNQGKESSK